jgi:hypothetical protein
MIQLSFFPCQVKEESKSHAVWEAFTEAQALSAAACWMSSCRNSCSILVPGDSSQTRSTSPIAINIKACLHTWPGQPASLIHATNTLPAGVVKSSASTQDHVGTILAVLGCAALGAGCRKEGRGHRALSSCHPHRENNASVTQWLIRAARAEREAHVCPMFPPGWLVHLPLVLGKKPASNRVLRKFLTRCSRCLHYLQALGLLPFPCCPQPLFQERIDGMSTDKLSSHYHFRGNPA